MPLSVFVYSIKMGRLTCLFSRNSNCHNILAFEKFGVPWSSGDLMSWRSCGRMPSWIDIMEFLLTLHTEVSRFNVSYKKIKKFKQTNLEVPYSNRPFHSKFIQVILIFSTDGAISQLQCSCTFLHDSVLWIADKSSPPILYGRYVLVKITCDRWRSPSLMSAGSSFIISTNMSPFMLLPENSKWEKPLETNSISSHLFLLKSSN